MELVRIQKGMDVCPQSTKALLMAVVVRPCVTDDEKGSEEEVRGLLLLPRDFLVLSRYGAGQQGT